MAINIDINIFLILIYLFTLVVLIYQYKLQRQPILNIKIKAQSRNTKQRNLEYIGGTVPPETYGGDDNYYLFISNDSTNIATNLKIELKYKVDGLKQTITHKCFLSYLNPNEYTRMILYFPKELLKKYPDKFKTIKKGDKDTIIPKETIKLILMIDIKHTPIIRGIKSYKIYNEYSIEWVGLDSMPTLTKTHMNCWNRRNGLDILQSK